MSSATEEGLDGRKIYNAILYLFSSIWFFQKDGQGLRKWGKQCSRVAVATNYQSKNVCPLLAQGTWTLGLHIELVSSFGLFFTANVHTEASKLKELSNSQHIWKAKSSLMFLSIAVLSKTVIIGVRMVLHSFKEIKLSF